MKAFVLLIVLLVGVSHAWKRPQIVKPHKPLSVHRPLPIHQTPQKLHRPAALPHGPHRSISRIPWSHDRTADRTLWQLFAEKQKQRKLSRK